MKSNNIRKLILCIIAAILIPLRVSGAAYWQGNNVFNPDEGTLWGVTKDEIVKVTDYKRVYSFDDINSYSAYITNNPGFLGNSIENSFFWFTKSRLAYVKLFKVKPGQKVSFLFNRSIYLYCAEFDTDFRLVKDGNWGTNGTVYEMSDDTSWIMVVFRQVNGDLSEGSGNDTFISCDDILAYDKRYIIFEPFKYTLDMNGGVYMDSTAAVTMNRLGVEQITLPTPERTGYIFKGWKSPNGKLYNKTLTNVFDEELFKDTTLTADWAEIEAESISLDREYAILEQNSGNTVNLKATVYPDNAVNKNVIFTSSDESIATVDADGKVTAGKTGVAEITARTANGMTAKCRIYVMGFEISLPSVCNVNQVYEVDINIYNNGSSDMEGRKRVIVDCDETVELVRVGDISTKCLAVAEKTAEYNGEFVLKNNEFFADTTDSEKVYYRLSEKEAIKKAGDYEGNVTFTVSVL